MLDKRVVSINILQKLKQQHKDQEHEVVCSCTKLRNCVILMAFGVKLKLLQTCALTPPSQTPAHSHRPTLRLHVPVSFKFQHE